MKLVSLTVNGRTRDLAVPEDETLLTTLRTRLDVTSVREGCAVGACGACTVLVSGRAVSACLARTVRYHGAELVTADGLPEDDAVVSAFVSEAAMQCGYCIPGFVLMAHEMLAEQSNPTDDEIDEYLEGNICRCGTYVEIRNAIRNAAQSVPGPAVP